MGAAVISAEVADTVVLPLLRQGVPDGQIREVLEDHHGITVSEQAIAARRRRLELPPATEVHRYSDLIPWRVRKADTNRHPVIMLRALGRQRAGRPLSQARRAELRNWIDARERTQTVVTYDRERGFRYVPRRADDVGYSRR